MREDVDVLYDDYDLDHLEKRVIVFYKKYPHFVLWTILYYQTCKNREMNGVVV